MGSEGGDAKWQYGYAIYEQEADGQISVSVGTNPKAPDVLAQFIIAAPQASEIERTAKVKEAMDDAIMRGMVIVLQKRVHNPVFDKRGEKSSTEVHIRPCRTHDEAMAAAGEIRRLFLARGLITPPLIPPDIQTSTE